MDLGLQGKKVVITGGSRGIGYASAELFLREGAEVTIVGRDRESVAQAQASLRARHGREAGALLADLSEEQGLAALQPVIAGADIVVNNAGAIPGGGFEGVDDATWRRAWELKVYGYLNVARQALPAMMERGRGVIVNVIGIAGAEPRYDYLCGSMANASLITFTRAAGAHSTRRGVRVVGLNPGPTQTDRLVTLYKARAREKFGDPERWQELLADLPFGRAALPEEMADLVVYLASKRASYLSGVVIDADGGGLYA
ncbi:MAG TPA: short-chain dehydrogenase/reductase [Ramlibacter sp.]|nr:short-chain dehydrogenase/reductase [Ramlibacter sp.]